MNFTLSISGFFRRCRVLNLEHTNEISFILILVTFIVLVFVNPVVESANVLNLLFFSRSSVKCDVRHALSISDSRLFLDSRHSVAPL